MKLLAATALAAALLLAPAPAPALALAATSQTLTGTYQWDNGSGGPLEARFTETAPGAWEVKFVFRFHGKKNTWLGTAKGTLGEGSLKGRAMAARMNRIWVFQAELADGFYRGRHAELVGEEEVPSGTFELRLEPQQPAASTEAAAR